MKFLLVLLLVLPGSLWAASPESILQLAETYLRTQTQEHPGVVAFRFAAFNGSRLADCERLEAFTPQGARTMGRTTVGVRCLTPTQVSILLQVQIMVQGKYLVSSRSLPVGHRLSDGDLQELTGDLGTLPNTVMTQRERALGRTLRAPVGAGQPIRRDILNAPWVVQQGQTVRVISHGNGYTASAEGKAVNNASEGQVVQVRMPSGQTVSGKAREDGNVEINF